MKFIAAMAALISLAVLPSVAGAETLMLDTHSSVKPKTQAKLPHGTWYVVTVQGTASFHYANTWRNPQRIWKSAGMKKAVICGTPEAAPLFPSPGTTSGQVGFDAETLFARPVEDKVCGTDPSPRTTRRFEISDGNYWFHPPTLSGRYTTPRPDHTYSYAVFGEGNKLQFRVRDTPVYDNYGQFKIDVRPATAADCAGRQWRNFYRGWGADAYEGEAACAAAMPAPVSAT